MKLDLTKEDKKILFLLLIVLIFVFVVIVIEIVAKIQELVNSTATLSPIKAKVVEIENTPKNLESNKISKYLSEIFEMMNNKEYDKLYSILAPDCKEALFENPKSFSELMEKYAPNQYTPKFTSYEKVSNMYIIPVTFLEKGFDENDLYIENPYIKADTFCIKELTDGTFSLSFWGFIGSKSSDVTIGNELIAGSIIKNALYTDSCSFIIKLDNFTDTDILLTDYQVSCVTGIYPRYYPYYVLIPAKSSTEITFKIPTGYVIKGALPREIRVNNVIIGDTSYNLILPVNYCFD